jgi:uncharacterized oligopeptide transporter (OPT) family protein
MTSVPRAFEWPAVLAYVGFAALSAAVCADINVHLGITPNTAVVGVLVALAAGRSVLPAFRSPERQVLVETATSAGGFAGANIGLVSLATLSLLGLERLMGPLLVGVAVGMVVDIWLGYRLFGTRAFPADAPWPDGEAVGRLIEAGTRGGPLARQILEGVGAGAVARLVGVPAAGVGIAFIGHPVALAALALGLVVRGHGSALGYPVAHSSVPHGLMIGAGVVQVAQAARLMRMGARAAAKSASSVGWPGADRSTACGLCGGAAPRGRPTDGDLAPRDLVWHGAAFVAGALVLAWLGGLAGRASLGSVLVWTIFAGAAAFVHTIVVGSCAMLSGWFPSFAVAIALVLAATLLGFSLEALALLAGYVLSTGPQFADLGYDLKSGWIVRGRGADQGRERAGRREQALLQEAGALVGLLTAALAFSTYRRLGLLPPMSRALAATVRLAASPGLTAELAAGGAIGALVQLAGGAHRAVGILLATGLLLDNVAYGYALGAALLVRAWVGTETMRVRGPGLIAGDGLAGFLVALGRVW